jgi:hypothetical protein
LPFALCLFAAAAVFTPAFQESAPTGARNAMQFSGEHLVYKIEWNPPWYFLFFPQMEAGEAEVQLVGETEYKGKRALQIRFKAHSSGTLVKLSGIQIEDEFVFFTEPETLCTLGSSAQIREGKRKRQIEVEYLRENRQLHIREIDESTFPSKLKKDEIKNDIPECVHDPLSALYLFRKSQLQDQYAQTFTLANDAKIREVRATVERQEVLPGNAGKAPAWRVNTVSLMGGLFKEGGQFKIWLSADDKKTPIQFEVKVHLGHILGRLKPMQMEDAGYRMQDGSSIYHSFEE